MQGRQTARLFLDAHLLFGRIARGNDHLHQHHLRVQQSKADVLHTRTRSFMPAFSPRNNSNAYTLQMATAWVGAPCLKLEQRALHQIEVPHTDEHLGFNVQGRPRVCVCVYLLAGELARELFLHRGHSRQLRLQPRLGATERSCAPAGRTRRHRRQRRLYGAKHCAHCSE